MKTLRASEIHAGEAVRVIAIESIRCKPHKAGGFYWLYGRIEPTALVVCTEGETQVVNLDSREIPLDELEREVHGLRALLDAPGEA